MTLREHYNNVIHLLNDPLSVIELAEAKCLPPVLHVSNISLLMYPESKNLQQTFVITLKSQIMKDILPVLTIEEYNKEISKHENQRNLSVGLGPAPSGQLPLITITSMAYQNTDFLDNDLDLNVEKRRMFVVHRMDMKRWLESEDEWPLSPNNLLSRWWPDILNENQISKDAIQKTVATEANKDDNRENIFRVEGQMWTLCYNGETIHIKPLKGLLYISYLIESPNQEYHVNELVRAADSQKNIVSFDSNEISTKKTITNYRESLSKIRKEMNKLENNVEDNIILNELLIEKDEIEKQLLQAVGLGGKRKKFPNETNRNANSVSEAIRRSLKAINKSHHSLWKHLNNSLHTGAYLSYTPEKDISWITIQ